MQILPDKAQFCQSYEQGQSTVVWASISADMLTPVSVALSYEHEDYVCLFESVEKGANRSRYSFITLSPDRIWTCREGRAWVCNEKEEEMGDASTNVMESLRSFHQESQLNLPDTMPAMASGIFGFFGYDMIRYIENLPDSNPDTIGIPEAVFIRPRIVLIFDSVQDEMMIVYSCFHHSDEAAGDVYIKACEAINDTLKTIAKRTVSIAETNATVQPFQKAESTISKENYFAMVEKAKDYIAAGDAFQIVPSQRFTMPFAYSGMTLYRSLRRLNPSPYSFYMKLKGFCLIGSSPEVLARLRDDRVTVRPIAGTRKRGKNDAEDRALAEDLLQDPKECAEHLMLVDLGRNDVGRVASAGSVEVVDYMMIEKYSHVMHLVSTVKGNLAPDKDTVDTLMATFPAGTVSGAPKIRAMEIIDELECERRSFYAGGVGYLSANGDMDICITLRTGLLKDNLLYVQAGGGVVADSDAEFEYQESCNKARAVLKAAENVYGYEE